AGLKPGQRVSVWLPNRAETIVVTLACSRNGYICNPSLHQSYTVADVVDLLTRIQSVALFAQQGFGADADRSNIFETAYQVATIKRVYRLKPVARAGSPNTGAGAMSIAAGLPAPVVDPDKIVLLAFTSGTTGEPKGVMHSDNTLLANARAMAADWRHHEDIVLLSMSPLTHAIGTIAMAQALVSGFELVLNDVPAGKTILDWIHETGATYIMGVPTHAIDILAELKRRGHDRLGKVSVFYMGGSAIPRETVRTLLDLGITPQNVYGMTENGAHQYTLPDDDTQAIVETCGRACAGYEVSIWSQEDPDVEVAQGEIGEIGGRGACLMLGYFDNQNATEQSYNRYGWFMTGDLGRLDETDRLQIVGRKKDLIIRGGRNIHPARIEDLARSHPSVSKAAAFPIADERLGEKVCLAVVLQDAASLDPQTLLRHLNERGLSKYDMPEYFVAVDAFPLTPSGKILKRELVEWARSGRIRPRSVRSPGSGAHGARGGA
ncbi:MAG: class I adenylate-forming enzyme family protein, partial [Pseudomonadota bacterium]